MKNRRLYPYNIHFNAAEYYLELSKDKDQSEEMNSTSCLVFTAFGIEAFVNHVGAQVFSFWMDNLERSLSPEAKLHLVAARIGLRVDFGKRPFQSFRTLFRFRNAMAHSVTEELSDKNEKHYLKLGNQSWPAAKWEKLRTSKIAEEISNDAETIMDIIVKKSGLKLIPKGFRSEFTQD
jgi:hypothetical protein